MTAPELDHLVVAAATLAQGVDYIRDRLGVEPAGGGTHVSQGTHNRLVRLGREQYLEIIAVDPDGRDPATPRWFGLDSPSLREALAIRPRLLTWVARTGDIEALAARQPGLGHVSPMSRGNLRWRITLTDDGHLPEDGLIPPLIQWDTAPHPATGLPDAGCELTGLEGRHDRPERVAAALRRLGLADRLTLTSTNGSGVAGLRARIRTPFGLRSLGDI